MQMKTKQFTTKSGEILTLTPVNQVDLAPLRNRIQGLQPQPPVEIVQSAGGPKEFVNEKDPAYLKAKQDFELTNGTYAFATIIELGVDLELTEEQQAGVERRRRKFKKTFGDLPQYDLDVYMYVSSICDDDELTEIANLISSINTPTPQQVQVHLDAFRDGVPGPTAHVDKDAPKWNNLKEPELDLTALPGGPVLGDKPHSFLRTVEPRVAG